jgi:preprotein translocase subunit SecA
MVSLGGIARKLFGSPSDRRVKSFHANVDAINPLEQQIRALTDEALAAKTVEFRKLLADGKQLYDLLVPAFAVVREASQRFFFMRPFDVQLVGGMILHSNAIAEMKTGEGKTLVDPHRTRCHRSNSILPGLTIDRAAKSRSYRAKQRRHHRWR